MPSRAEPARAATYLDARGDQRAMRVTWHLDDRSDASHDTDDEQVAVLSLWRANVCTATFRLPLADVPGLVNLLCEGLEAALRTPASELSAEVPRLRA